MLKKELAQNIKKYRIMNNLQQEDLAKKLGVSLQTVSRMERGQTMPKMEVIGKLSDIFEVPVYVLFLTEKELADTRKKEFLIERLYEIRDESEDMEEKVYVDYLKSEYEEMKDMLDDFADRYAMTTEHERRFSNQPNDDYFAFLVRLATFIFSEEKLINSQEMRLDRKNGRLRVHKTLRVGED